ncbi:uncharacterized protein LOC113500790 [Trichoplusia ni]|uniref:Uncharacterized protein LOC113500790 n=1 Tax=Trichoplusia ni TaxID=7111 RepID=A0A7E5WAL9_TRINI|nr:uncharacterized protein LOC113500790 [Trichoplusia ni]XP_026737491.1 uncharacterized protein LOC113500790 [Trichoplusia ni]XP_026737492.1 uncharacterized protein LOC113500790 [Trichoplusia ni]
MFYKTLISATLILNIVSPSLEDAVDPKQEVCNKISSCSSCIAKSFCTWCVTKSKCTKQSCGNDNIIYPKDFSAIMAGPTFCPRVVEPEQTLTVKSGVKQVIAVKITQIHLYMAFTPWKCKIDFNGKQLVVPAVLLGDQVYCESVLLTNKPHEPHETGEVSVLWDYTKSFDGSVPFKVCRCDLDPSCNACNKLTNTLMQ